MPIYYGVDVATFQGVINWATLKTQKDFAIIKATGGDAGLYTDGRFVTNAFGARSVGIKRGFYHFGSLGLNNAVTEANYFTAAIGAPQAGEILVLDAESEAGAGIVLSQSSVAWCKAFLDQVAATVGFKPFIYMSQYPSYSIDWSSVAGAGYPLWVASYGVAPTGSNLSVGAWSNLGKGYPIHQYSSSGVVSGIGSNPVDLDAFFVPAGGTLNNWDGYGKGGTTTTVGATNIANTSVTPTTTQARVTAASFYFQSDNKSLITPTESYDLVIYSVKTSDATLATGSHNGFYTIPTKIAQQGYPFGRFSYDGGSSWNDFGFTYPVVSAYGPVQPGVYIQPSVLASGSISFSGVNNTAGTVSLIIEVGVLASNNPSPVPTPLVLGSKTSYTNDASPIPSPTYQNFLLPPYSVYRRVAVDTSVLNVTNTTHNQTTIPNVMFWVQDVAKAFTTINAVSWSSAGPLGPLGIYMDSTKVHTYVDSTIYGNCFLRIYKDNA